MGDIKLCIYVGDGLKDWWKLHRIHSFLPFSTWSVSSLAKWPSGDIDEKFLKATTIISNAEKNCYSITYQCIFLKKIAVFCLCENTLINSKTSHPTLRRGNSWLGHVPGPPMKLRQIFKMNFLRHAWSYLAEILYCCKSNPWLYTD